MLHYLYKHWAQMGIAIALYVTTVLVCNVHSMVFLVFLIWLQFPVYLIHQFEEHAWPGHFKDFFNRDIFHVLTADVPLNQINAFWINILAVWILIPLCAVLAQTVTIQFGILVPYFSLVNGTVHLVAFIRLRRYNPGLLSSLCLNYPVGIYTLVVAQQNGVLNAGLNTLCIGVAVGIHVVIATYLIRRYQKFKAGKLPL